MIGDRFYVNCSRKRLSSNSLLSINPAFLFLTANLAPCLWIEQDHAPLGLAGKKSSSLPMPRWGWPGKNHPRFAAVFFPAKPCTIPAGSNLARKKQKYWLQEPVMSNCIKDSKYENRSKPNEN